MYYGSHKHMCAISILRFVVLSVILVKLLICFKTQVSGFCSFCLQLLTVILCIVLATLLDLRFYHLVRVPQLPNFNWSVGSSILKGTNVTSGIKTLMGLPFISWHQLGFNLMSVGDHESLKNDSPTILTP